MSHVLNRVHVATATTGTGTVSLGAAETGMQTFAAAGAISGRTYAYVIEEGSAWEIGTGTWTSGTPDTLTRTLVQSSTGALLALAGAAKVMVAPIAANVGLNLLRKTILTTGTSWTPTGDAELYMIQCIAGGGGGATGARGVSTANRAGGNGGNGGRVSEVWITAADLGAGPFTYSIGAGGTAGAALASGTTDVAGAAGGAGGNTTFVWGNTGTVSALRAGGGDGGNAPTATAAGAVQAQSTAITSQQFTGQGGATGGLGISGPTPTLVSGTTGPGAGGGGGGSATTTGNAGGAGAVSTLRNYNNSAAISVSPSNAGAAGAAGTAGGSFTDNRFGHGGGGGGSSPTAAGGAGGDGGTPGGGGGGGGSSGTGTANTGGRGGAGARGEIRIYEFG